MSHSSPLFGDERLFLQLLGPFVCNGNGVFLDLVIVNLVPLVIGVFHQCFHFLRIQGVETIVKVDFVTSLILWQFVTKQISHAWKLQCFCIRMLYAYLCIGRNVDEVYLTHLEEAFLTR